MSIFVIPSSPFANKRALSTIWALLPAVTAGLAAPFTFTYAAVRLRSRILGCCAAVYAIFAFLSFLLAIDADRGTGPYVGLGTAIALVTMIVSTVHGFAVRPQLLQDDAQQRTALADAEHRIRRMAKARHIAATNPRLADELRIGRPDLPRQFDDGGLVDVNHVTPSVLAEVPGIGPSLADRIVSTREDVGGFQSLDDLSITLGIPPQRLDRALDVLIFLR